MKRTLLKVLEKHFDDYNQMVFLAGPRQVGKTTLSKDLQKNGSFSYLNWDETDHREIILKGASAISEFAGLHQLHDQKKLVILDEIHKYPKWKNFLKGFYDQQKSTCKILVTGSSRLDVFKKGSDSLMGRYFYYRLHPISLRESFEPEWREGEIQEPISNVSEKLKQLIQFGGFPDPFLKKSTSFYNRWQNLRNQQYFNEDIRDLGKVQEVQQMELLAAFLREQSGSMINYSKLASKVRVSVDTIRRWCEILRSTYAFFFIRPWSKNVSRSLLKEPKVYAWDWSIIRDEGARIENLVASHLLKWIHFLTDTGQGNYSLHFLRDKEKREVDFLVVKDEKPFLMLEVKKSENKLSKNLVYFQEQLQAKYCLQAVLENEPVQTSCFQEGKIMSVPLSTFLSQLI